MIPAENTEELRAKLRDLQTVLRQNDRRIQSVFKMSPALANCLGLLLSLDVVQGDLIDERLELSTQARSIIFRLRKHLKPYGIRIKSHRTVGWWLDADTKAKINRMLNPGG